MTNQEAIAYGNNYYRDLIMACCEIDEKHKEFVRMSLEALKQEPCDEYIKEIDHLRKYISKLETQVIEQEPCSDVISRKEAIKKFTYNYKGKRIPEYDCENWPVQIDIKTVKEILRSLPPVTPQQKSEDIAKAFQFGLAFGFAKKYDEMDKVMEEVKKKLSHHSRR